MTPAARVHTAIELVQQVVDAARRQGPPADRVIAEWARVSRFAGSKDRRAVRELVYRAIRACGPIPPSGRAAMLHLARSDPALLALFDGSTYGPAPVAQGEPVADGGVAPEWLVKRLASSDIAGAEAEALLDRAPLDVRVNALKATRESVVLPLAGEALAAPHGLRFPSGTAVEGWDAHRTGLIEIQDGGSQLACEAVGARAGETVMDLCAGAGGKTLALAAAMDNQGTLVAADSDRGRLSRLGPRAERAGARIAETVLLDPGREAERLRAWDGMADAVLVDAPCSGTGTWRRNPEARWRLTSDSLTALVALQQRLLGIAAALVKPGGRLVYVVCSLLDEEGPAQVAAFLAANPGWSAQPVALPQGSARGAGVRLTPHRDGTDGFFIARLCKPW